MMRVVHLTSAHPRYDTRIFLKMCRSLAAAGYDTFLVVADGLGDERREEVQILDAGKSRQRLSRMLAATRRVADRGLALDADLYHIHDPELLPVALRLKRQGKQVIFDAHEDLPRQILSKFYLHPVVRHPIAAVMAGFERFACRRLDAVVGATPIITEKFVAMGVPASNVNNYPILGELESETVAGPKEREVCYVGGIVSTRGIREIVQAVGLSHSDVRLTLAGTFVEPDVQNEVERMAGWPRVDALGFLSRDGVRDVLARSMAGLVTLHPTAAFLDSLPIKMFEYMSAGLPVIASNFPLWREIIEGNQCGICVDPMNPAAIAAAIDQLAGNPELAKQMGEKGRRAVYDRYNWGQEEKNLLRLYGSLLTPF